MPQYDYICDDCKKEVPINQSINDPIVIPNCPECGKETRRVYQSFGIHFKGKGFYKTGG